MPYQANVYNVMLASPGDVAEERQIARQVILDWNNVNSLSRKIILLPIGWETNSTPTMGDRPQEIINKQVLNNADLLVGIFWTRVGTPTGRAISGSVEEIEEHITSGKPAMLYFSNKPVVPSSINQEQYSAVLDLKQEFRSRGLTEDFDSPEDFRAKFQRHLYMKINNDYFFEGFQTEDNELVDSIIIDSRMEISEEAKELLLAAVEDEAGQILRINMVGGIVIEAGSKEFGNVNDQRSRAMWENVIVQLENNHLIISLGTKREIFEVTYKGYEFADSIKRNA